MGVERFAMLRYGIDDIRYFYANDLRFLETVPGRGEPRRDRRERDVKVPLRWLADYVPITLPVEELAHRLSMAGAEVESIERSGGDWGDLVRVGLVTAVEPHPAADRLRLASVDYGRRRPPDGRLRRAQRRAGAEDRLRAGRAHRCSTAHSGKTAQAQAVEDPRRGLRRHGLLRAGTRPLR